MLGERPPAVFDICQSYCDHQVVLATTLVMWAHHLSLGLNTTLRHLSPFSPNMW